MNTLSISKTENENKATYVIDLGEDTVVTISGNPKPSKLACERFVRAWGIYQTFRAIQTPSAGDYARARRERGTRKKVAESLRVGRATLYRRETGKTRVTREAWLALLAIPKT